MPKPRGGQRLNYSPGGSWSAVDSINDLIDDHGGRRDTYGGMRMKERTTRRVSFKPSNSHSSNLNHRMTALAIRSRLEDDEDMGDFASTSAKFESSQPRRKGSPIPKGKFAKRFGVLPKSPYGWYQIMVTGGQRYTKEELFRSLRNEVAPEDLIALYFRADKNCVVFFMTSFSVAEKLNDLGRDFRMPDGYRLNIRARSGFPFVEVDEALKEQMKEVMATRFSSETNALDLTRFHLDPKFKHVFRGLFHAPMLTAVLDIIEKNIPQLMALNLNGNRLSSLEVFKDIGQRLPNLQILYLGDNDLTSMANLQVLRNIPIVELVLSGNPLRQRYKDHALYVRDVRHKFPKLRKLDSENLEPRILFDVNDSALPTPKASFLCDVAGADIIRQFLEQYFLIFDSDNRQPLLDAYHEQAMMTITVPPASQAGRLVSFWKYNRNLRRQLPFDDANKMRNVKVGRLAVVSLLAEWPKTQHDPQTFSVDLTLFSPTIISFTVAGLFKELESGSTTEGEVRYFQRQLVVVPAGGGFCIRNELILITNATVLQARAFKKATVPPLLTPSTLSPQTPAPGNLQNRLQMQQNQASTSAAAGINQVMLQQAQSQVNDATKLQMVQAMSTQSNMNLDWSRKCLEETNWDYNHAIFVFDKLHKEHKIPPEAFVK